MQKIVTKKFWLTGLLLLTLSMIVLGGVTRLTRSGLSITEWRPITGVILPLGAEQWDSEFKKYQMTEEFKILHSHFQLEDFKKIFLMEYFHRILGRIIFLFSAFIGVLLCLRKKINWSLYLLVNFWILMQGLAGWLMVKSGLGKSLTINPLMLSTHFFMALGLIFILLRAYLENAQRLVARVNWRDRLLLNSLGVVLVLQLFFGTLTSATKAGLVSSTFPLMQGELAPNLLWTLKPLGRNLLENKFTIQWIHRWLGVLTLLIVSSLVLTIWNSRVEIVKGPLKILVALVALQVLLGVVLIWLQVPMALASLHQLLGTLVFMAFLNLNLRIN